MQRCPTCGESNFDSAPQCAKCGRGLLSAQEARTAVSSPAPSPVIPETTAVPPAVPRPQDITSWTDDLRRASSDELWPLLADTLSRKGRAATFDALTAVLEGQAPAPRARNCTLVALTGDPRVLDWLERNIGSPVTRAWGEAAALAGIRWPQVKRWLERGAAHRLAALDALLGYRAPAPNMSPICRKAAPVLQQPPGADEIRAELQKAAREQPTPRVTGTVAAIEGCMAEILRGGLPGCEPCELPNIVVALEAQQQEADRIDDGDLERRLGPCRMVCHEFLPPPDIKVRFHLDVKRFPPTRDRPFETLVTVGMAARPMKVPQGGVPDRAELMMHLPPDWFPAGVSEGSLLDDSPLFWPVHLLKTLARLPHEEQTWLGAGHTVGPFPQPFPGTDLDTVLLLPPAFRGDDLRAVRLQSGGEAVLLVVHVLHRGEASLKMERGLDALIELLGAFNVSEVFRPQRPDVTKTPRRRWWDPRTIAGR